MATRYWKLNIRAWECKPPHNAGIDPQWTAEAVRKFEPKCLIQPCAEYPCGKWEETPAIFVPHLRGVAIDCFTPLFGFAIWRGFPGTRNGNQLLIDETLLALFPAAYRHLWSKRSAFYLLPEVWAYGKEVELTTWRDKWRWLCGKDPIGKQHYWATFKRKAMLAWNQMTHGSYTR